MYKIFLYYLISTILLFIFFPACQTGASGYFIRVHLKGSTEADSLSLRRLEESKPLVIQTVKINSGKAIFSGKLALKPGWYTTSIAKKTKFDFLVSDTLQQHFNISADNGNIPATLAFEYSPENTDFSEYQRFLDDCQKQRRTILLRMRRNNGSPDSVKIINNSFMQLNEQMENRADLLKKNYPGSMLALYIGLTREPQVPEPVIPTMVTDRNRYMQDYYLRYQTDHFLDEIDFSDIRIVSIPRFEEKLRYFFFQLIEPVPEVTEPVIEMVIEKARASDDVFRFTVKFLYRMFRESALPSFLEESVFIGEKFILDDPGRWNDDSFVENVREKVAKARLNPIGSVATDLKLTGPAGKTIRLSEVRARRIILYFFNPECEACIPISEKLNLTWQKFKNQGVEVFAVYLDRKSEIWKQFINSEKLEWIHGWDPTGEEEIEKKYDIYALPMIYLLDQNKKIIIKDVPVEKLEEFLQS
jgi:peroxiredoxin